MFALRRLRFGEFGVYYVFAGFTLSLLLPITSGCAFGGTLQGWVSRQVGGSYSPTYNGTYIPATTSWSVGQIVDSGHINAETLELTWIYTSTMGRDLIIDDITIIYDGTPFTQTPSPTHTPTHTPTPTNTPTASPVPSSNIRYSNDLGQPSSNWSGTEIGYIETAVQNVGEAFQIQLSASTPQEAFNRVMTNGANPQYVYFFKADGTSSSVTIVYPSELSKPNFAVNVAIGGCLTVNNNGLPRTIVCNWATPATYPVHAIVHELGHVFTNRSIISSSDSDESTHGLLYAAIEGTYSGTCTPAFDANNNPNPFAGMVFNVSSCSSINDLAGGAGLVMGRDDDLVWHRGERGWGSGPDNIFTPFQQHPLDVFSSDPPVAQVDETAADMFLNWVYRRRTNNPPTYQTTVPGNWEGFSNQKWLNNGAGENDPNFPGDARFEWMSRVMDQIFTLKGW